MFATIAWATDGSEHADLALSYAVQLALAGGGRIVALHYDELFAAGRARGLPLHVDEEEVRRKIARQVERLAFEAVDARLVVRRGPDGEAARAIADAAREAGASVIVVGTRGHGPLAGAVLGSVAQGLLQHASCPVLVIPVAAQEAQRPL